MRLIDADTLSEKLCETTIFIKDGEVFQRMINDAPTIDAAQVVRCKYCKHLYKDGECPLRTWFTHTENDFCSYGERLCNNVR